MNLSHQQVMCVANVWYSVYLPGLEIYFLTVYKKTKQK